MNKCKILITGINGFIGSNLANYIREKYPLCQIYGIDKSCKGLGNYNYEIDIKEKKKLKSIICKHLPKYIFHLSGKTSSENIKQLVSSNVFNTFILLDTILNIENYGPRILIPSSASEYGSIPSNKLPVSEEELSNPKSFYGFSKMMQTELSRMFVRKNMDIVIARVFNIVGKDTPVKLAIGRFAHILALIKKGKRKPVIYTRNLDTARDFLDYRDVCRYIVDIALNGKKGEIYNVCRGRSYKIRELLNELIRISGIPNIKIVTNKKSLDMVDLDDSFGEIKKLKKISKSDKNIPIIQSLEETYLYYLSKI
ncbi:MAG: GDP-mannose 4,6-dehydratase [Parcubacteria group bacterium]|nr:GDP-mannose 4,6-dehydratase [Parcubacteria group bacterium]